jgi:hypothetical protein
LKNCRYALYVDLINWGTVQRWKTIVESLIDSLLGIPFAKVDFCTSTGEQM